jgi:hypothetical protein
MLLLLLLLLLSLLLLLLPPPPSQLEGGHKPCMIKWGKKRNKWSAFDFIISGPHHSLAFLVLACSPSLPPSLLPLLLPPSGPAQISSHPPHSPFFPYFFPYHHDAPPTARPHGHGGGGMLGEEEHINDPTQHDDTTHTHTHTHTPNPPSSLPLPS